MWDLYMYVNVDQLVLGGDVEILTSPLRSQGQHPSWYCEFLGDRLYRSVGSEPDDEVSSDDLESERENFLKYLKTAHNDGTIASGVQDFWRSRICDQPSEEQVQFALDLNSPLLVLETTLRKYSAEFASDLVLATTNSIQRLSELFGIEALGELFSKIPIERSLNTNDSASNSNARVVLDGIREFIRVILLHGCDQFADKHFQVQFSDVMRFDQCEVSHLVESRWQLRMSSAAYKVLLMPSRVGWLLVNQWTMISGLVKQGNKVRLCLADGADESNVPADDYITIAFCATGETIDRIILVEDTYSARARQLLMAYPEPFDKKAARALYDRRMDKVFWRGSTTGAIHLEADELADRLLSNQRVRFCLEARLGSKRIDALITDVVQVSGKERISWINQLKKWSLLGAKVTEKEFLRYRYYVDLDGNSAAWGTFQKYLGLCLVIKPVSQWRLLNHEMLLDGVNFLEVSKASVAEIEKILDRYDEDALFEIAYQGHLTAHEYLRNLAGNPEKRICVGHKVEIEKNVITNDDGSVNLSLDQIIRDLYLKIHFRVVDENELDLIKQALANDPVETVIGMLRSPETLSNLLKLDPLPGVASNALTYALRLRKTNAEPEKRFFMHIPKTGGTSVIHHLNQHSDWPWLQTEDQTSLGTWPLVAGHLHWSYFPSNSKGFTIFRDPLQRLISHWQFSTSFSQHFQGKENQPNLLNFTFTNFLAGRVERAFFNSQMSWFFTNKPTAHLDHENIPHHELEKNFTDFYSSFGHISCIEDSESINQSLKFATGKDTPLVTTKNQTDRTNSDPQTLSRVEFDRLFELTSFDYRFLNHLFEKGVITYDYNQNKEEKLIQYLNRLGLTID